MIIRILIITQLKIKITMVIIMNIIMDILTMMKSNNMSLD